LLDVREEAEGNVSQIFRHDFTVGKETVDENGHVNNVEYIRWMQEAAISHSDKQGCTQTTKALGATWVVRTHRIEYFRPAFAGDQIAVLTWVSDFRKVRSLRKYKFIRVKDNALLAEGETDWVFVDAASGRPRAIPKEVSGVFEVVPEEREPKDLEHMGQNNAG